MEIAQHGDPDSYFRWEFSLGGENAGQNPMGAPWQVFQGVQVAYELWTPEPTTALLLAGPAFWTLTRRARS